MALSEVIDVLSLDTAIGADVPKTSDIDGSTPGGDVKLDILTLVFGTSLKKVNVCKKIIDDCRTRLFSSLVVSVWK